MHGIIAAALVAHVPTLSRAEITPEYQRTLVEGERALGAALRARLRPDLWVVASAHWVATFNWLVTCQAMHEGVCVADEAPDLIPGIAYRYPGDPEFAAALVEAFEGAGIPVARNDSPHYAWDYGTFVPLSHLDPVAETAMVGLPSVLMADRAECVRAGAVIHAAAKRLGRRAVFVASTALSHVLVRGRQNWPTPERMAADRRFIEQMQRGAVDEALAELEDYSVSCGVEMGGRVLATYLGLARELAHEGKPLAAKQYGEYAQSSGSGNAVLLLGDSDTLSGVH